MTKFSTVSARLDIELLTSQQRMREVRCVYTYETTTILVQMGTYCWVPDKSYMFPDVMAYKQPLSSGHYAHSA